MQKIGIRMFALQQAGSKKSSNSTAKKKPAKKATYKQLALVGGAFLGLLVTAKGAAYAIKEYRVCAHTIYSFIT